MKTVGRFLFYESYIAFHLRRDNLFSGWEVEGLYMVCPKFQKARYSDFGGVDLTDDWHKELKLAKHDSVRQSREFLDAWRKRHQNELDVITPVVTYYTTNRDYNNAFSVLYSRYVGAASTHLFAQLAVMLRSPKGYFASLYNYYNRDYEEMKAALEEANLV